MTGKPAQLTLLLRGMDRATLNERAWWTGDAAIKTFAAIAAVLSGALITNASETQAALTGAEPPVAALAFFVGEWDQVGTVRPDPRSDYVSLSGTQTCSWIDARSAVACREAVSSGADDRSDSVYVLSWDSNAGLYRIQGTDYATGTVLTGTGRRSGPAWRWDTVLNAGGVRSELRYLFEDGDGGTRRLTVSMKEPDGAWATVQNVTYIRSAPSAAAARASPLRSPATPTRSLPAGTPRIGGSALSPSQIRSAAPPEPIASPPAKLRIEAPEIRSVRESDKQDYTYPVPKLLPEGERPGRR